MKRASLALCCFLSLPVLAQTVIRVNQVGYLPQTVKVAVAMTRGNPITAFAVCDALTGDTVLAGRRVAAGVPYDSWKTYRLDFTRLKTPGAYTVVAGGVRSPQFRIAPDVYDGAADVLLRYMRQQRCGYNPFLKDSCHTRDGYIVYGGDRDSAFVDVVGGWHDAADYLQYVTTSATAVFQMLFAYERHPGSFGDSVDAIGNAIPNGIPDILDEAIWGLRWLLKMNPAKDLMFNQVADDRDHLGFRLPTLDTVSYGRGRERPVYRCTGEPQGIYQYKNRSTGLASTAGKFASAFGLGCIVLRQVDPALAQQLRQKAIDAYVTGKAHPGVCQTAPCRAPYFYEEENWADDMELAATQLYRLTGDTSYRADAVRFGRSEPVVPWMGAEGARHYQWYPFVNLGHSYLAASGVPAVRREFGNYQREGIERIQARGASRPFGIGVPFIWCSNNLVSAAATQARAYAEILHDSAYAREEARLRDWLFGCNPWGTSMIVGFPGNGVAPHDPHSAFSHLNDYPVDGGLVDGPVRASIFNSLKGVRLSKDDPFAPFQSDSLVYHDDWADYSTDEPTMDGTAGLTYYVGALAERQRAKGVTTVLGGITRGDSTRKVIYLAFTGHEFAGDGETIRSALRRHGIHASFFLTGDFYRNDRFAPLIRKLRKDGNYLGAHSDRHLLYCPWSHRDSLLVTREEWLADLKNNYAAMKKFGITRAEARWFLPPYEWYNATIASWCRDAGLTLVNFTPGTRSNADDTYPGKGYVSSDAIERSIRAFERSRNVGLNGSILLMHIGTDPRRTDKLSARLDRIIGELKTRGYAFARIDEGLSGE